MTWAYYSEHDPFAAEWLRNLIAAGLITDGEVDERDIREVQPDDLEGFERCHLFAGIGVWDLALNLAGWDGPVWTGSCPCPPFSSAGKRQICPACESPHLVWCPRRTGHAVCSACGHAWLADARHLWPEMWRLVAHRRPPVIFGEQVESPDGRCWLAGVRGSLEICSYAVGAADLCAAAQGAPHIRQRYFWVAESDDDGRRARPPASTAAGHRRSAKPTGACVGRLADSHGGKPRNRGLQPGGQHGQQSEDGGVAGGLGDTDESRPQRRDGRRNGSDECAAGPTMLARGLGQPQGDGRERGTDHEDQGRRQCAPGYSGPWRSVPLLCNDGKWRRVPCDEEGELESEIFPLVDAGSVGNRVGILRGSGNAIVAETAAAFIRAYREITA